MSARRLQAPIVLTCEAAGDGILRDAVVDVDDSGRITFVDLTPTRVEELSR